jgi:hypothetical protein
MIYALFVGSGVLFGVLSWQRRRMQQGGATKTFRFLLIENTLDFLLPFLAVTLFYSILSASVSNAGSDQSTIALLQEYERRLQSVKDLLKSLKLTPGYSFLVLLCAFFLALLARSVAVFGPYEKRIEKLHSLLGKYHKWIGHTAIVVGLLASFTFFEKGVSAGLGRVQIAITDTRGKGEEVRREIEEAVAREVAPALAQQLSMVSPPLEQVFAVYEQFVKDYEKFRREKAATEEYRISSPETERLDAELKRRQTKLNHALEQVAPAERAEAPIRAYEGSLSKQKAKLMEAALQKRSSVFAARRAKEVFGSPLGREVGNRILKAILSEKHLPGIKNLTTDFPIVEPMLAILTESVRKKVAASISEATDRIAEKGYREGGSTLEPEIAATAADIASGITRSVPVVSAQVLVEAERAGRADLAKVETARDEYRGILEVRQTKLREANHMLAQKLSIEARRVGEATKLPTQVRKAPKVLETDDPLLSPEISRILKGPRSAEADSGLFPSKFATAVDKLIEESSAIGDPLAQNKFLTRVETELFKGDSYAKKVGRLAALAGECPGAHASADQFKNIVAETRPVEPSRPWLPSYDGSTHPRSFEPSRPERFRPIEPVHPYRPPVRIVPRR